MTAGLRLVGISCVALGFAVLAFGLSAPPARALEIDAQCKQFKNPIGQIRCTCALQTGGWLSITDEGKPKINVARPRTPNQRSIGNPAYDKCANQNGGTI